MVTRQVSGEGGAARGPYKKSSATRERIIDAATMIFGKHGYRNGSTTQIAALAEVSSSQIFYYFPTKQAVLEAVLDRRDRLADEVAGPALGDPREVPSAILRIAAINESVPDFISLYSLLVAEATAREHPAHDYFRDRYRRLRVRFEAAFHDMEIAGLLAPGIDAAYAAASTLAIWDGIQVQWLVEPESISVVQCLRRHLSAITIVVEPVA
jgi:AcrR family transcriptional regulator